MLSVSLADRCCVPGMLLFFDSFFRFPYSFTPAFSLHSPVFPPLSLLFPVPCSPPSLSVPEPPSPTDKRDRERKRKKKVKVADGKSLLQLRQQPQTNRLYPLPPSFFSSFLFYNSSHLIFTHLKFLILRVTDKS